VWQSPTWGRPAPQIRVESQFRQSIFLSQQWQVAWKSLVRILPLYRKLWTLTRWILSFHDYFFFWGGGPTSTFGCVLAILGQSVARVKIWGAAPHKDQNVFSRKKVHEGANLLRSITVSFVDRSIPTFFRPTWEGLYRFSGAFPIFDMLIRFGDIRDQSRKLSKIAQNSGRFFLPSKFFWAGPCKNCTHVITPAPASRDVDWKSSVRILPLLLTLKRWILSQIFNVRD